MAEKCAKPACILPPVRQPAYRQATAEFDRLWESGESKRQPQRMRELLSLIEAFESAPRPYVNEGINHATCNA
jgi:hypothetical protein